MIQDLNESAQQHLELHWKSIKYWKERHKITDDSRFSDADLLTGVGL